MIPGVEDALIFVKLSDGTVHQIDLPKARTLDVLKRFGDQIKLCEVAEPLTWERPESGAGSNSVDPKADSRAVEGKEKQGVQVPRPEPPSDYLQKTKYLDTKTGELKLY